MQKRTDSEEKIEMKEKKLVALTFDDGPTIGITDQVLDVLQENQVTASFPDRAADYASDRVSGKACT